MLLGKIVHYYPDNDEVCRAALVVKKWSEDIVNLIVYSPLTSPDEHLTEPYTSITRGKGEGHWHAEDDCPFSHAL